MPWQSGMFSGATNEENAMSRMGPSITPPRGMGRSSTVTGMPASDAASSMFLSVAR